jgi:hypothetical protein
MLFVPHWIYRNPNRQWSDMLGSVATSEEKNMVGYKVLTKEGLRGPFKKSSILKAVTSAMLPLKTRLLELETGRYVTAADLVGEKIDSVPSPEPKPRPMPRKEKSSKPKRRKAKAEAKPEPAAKPAAKETAKEATEAPALELAPESNPEPTPAKQAAPTPVTKPEVARLSPIINPNVRLPKPRKRIHSPEDSDELILA